MDLRQVIRATLEGRPIESPPPILSRICDLDAALKIGITLRLEDLTQEEFGGLRILNEEREKFELRNRVREQGMELMRSKRDSNPQAF